MYTVYECQRNSDQTEGRGRMVTFAVAGDESTALDNVRGQGVMGYGDGEIVKVVYASGPDEFVNGNPVISTERIYGYHRNIFGDWHHGWTDDRDLVEDPEWQTYVRLRKKFEDNGSRYTRRS